MKPLFLARLDEEAPALTEEGATTKTHNLENLTVNLYCYSVENTSSSISKQRWFLRRFDGTSVD